MLRRNAHPNAAGGPTGSDPLVTDASVSRPPASGSLPIAPSPAVAPATTPIGWDAIVVGASFAGLAAAQELGPAARVLLIDRHPVGQQQTSACATPLAVLERLDALESVEQVHEWFSIHLPGGRVLRLRLHYPFATFDYGRFCALLLARTEAHFLLASARGIDGGRVVTDRGVFQARVVIDASGAHAVLASSLRRGYVSLRGRGVGIECRVPSVGDDLHFWLHHDGLRRGYHWDFPSGDHRRVGVGRFPAGGEIKGLLQRFTGRPVRASDLHGGILPYRLREPAVDGLLVVGDAAGQCLPLGGEGIRTALVLGQVAGRLSRDVLDGRLALGTAQALYRRQVRAMRPYFATLTAIQWVMAVAPDAVLSAIMAIACGRWLSVLAQRKYWDVADPTHLRSGPSRGSLGSPVGSSRTLSRMV